MSFEIVPGCDGCAVCVAACPRGAITRSPAGEPIPFAVSALACNDCGKCAIVCPQAVLRPAAGWAVCRGRGCPITTTRLEGWACTEGWARCPQCGSALWKRPDDDVWRCARCELESRVVCPKARRANLPA